MDSAIDPSLRFKISDLLATPDDLVRIVRLLVATRHLTGLTHSLAAISPSRSPAGREAEQVLTLHLVGAAKEAADRFRDCDSNGSLDLIADSGENGAQFRDELATARRMTAKDDPTSLYSNLLKPFRDDIAFHIQRDAVIEALGLLEGEEFVAAHVDQDQRVLEVPLASAVMLSASWVRSPAASLDRKAVEDVMTLQAILRNLVHDHFLLLVRLSTLPDAPTAN